ncbi:hypothetical protein Cgig2_014492 [Carnegiea gigantea]|uniref:Uncharacterized protein n=1 Tax=Carnegiea gigantea TaxID=171969 RepID=A0A9Q1JK27_9CARY|nr:hypothetical protein Cgig2_014492 [Carnegiea gigantea]
MIQVVDCRICGDPHSVLRFAFVEFADEHGARAALNLGGTMLGYYPVRVLPSKTAILPVNPTFLPRVSRLRLLGDNVHSTRIAFVEFTMGNGIAEEQALLVDLGNGLGCPLGYYGQAESAILALNCSGMILGTQPIRYVALPIINSADLRFLVCQEQ